MKTSNLLKVSSLIGLSVGLLSSTVSLAGAHGPKAHGRIAIDDTLFMGSVAAKGAEFHSGAQLNTGYIGLSGGFDKDVAYTFDLVMDGADRKLKVSDAYITFLFPSFDHLNVSVGQVNPAFSVENTNSGAWIPFLTRSMPTQAFGPDQGLGVNANHWGDNYSLSVSLLQPIQGDPAVFNATNASTRSSDNVGISARAAFAVYKDKDDAVQVGFSGSHVNFRRDNAWLRYTTNPEGSGRMNTNVLDTNMVAGTRSILAAYNTTLDAELSAQFGPVWGEFEYQREYIGRVTAPNLTFSGYHVQATYFLTGEQREHSLRDATFKKIKPLSKRGAWEIGARYSYIDLNSREILGGTANNTTFGVNWYSTNNIRVSANYIWSNQRPGTLYGTAKRNLDILGVRCQYIF